MKDFFSGVKLAGRMSWRDWRSGELRLLLLALVVAVASVTSVGFFVDRIRNGLERDAAQMLGGDLVLIADQPIGDAARAEAQRLGLATAESAQFPSMALGAGKSELAALKVVSGGYPLRGALRLADGPDAAETPVRGLPAAGTAWVDANMLANLGVRVGEQVRLGDKDFTIAKVIVVEPDRGFSFVNLSPRVMIRSDDLAATHLVQDGSRISYRLYVSGDNRSVQAYRAWLGRNLGRGQRVETVDEGQPQVRDTIDRAERFLALVALASAMLAAVAVALAARRFSLRHLDACAVMRCLGLAQDGLLGLFVGEFMIVGAIGAAVGSLFGMAGHLVLVQMLAALVTRDLPPPTVLPAVQGFLIGFVLLLGFALPPVVQLRKVTPLRVLRRDVGAPRAFTTLGYFAALAAFGLLLLWSARDLTVGGLTGAGFLGAFGLFGGVAWLALRGLRALRTGAVTGSAMGASLRFALAAMQRRPAATIVQSVALSIGLMALLLLSVTRTDLVDAWRKAAPADAPNRFVINIQPDQRADFARKVGELGLKQADFEAMVRGRLVAINGKAVDVGAYADERARRLVDREFNLSYMDKLPAHNRISAGKWLSGPGEVSVEEGIARTLGLKLGDTLEYDIGGLRAEGRITSLRALQWDSMRVNFFVIFDPATLREMPQTWIAALSVPPGKTDLANRMVQAFPNLTVFDMSTLIRQIQEMLDQVIAAVEFLFVFTLLAGLLVLYAALLSSRDERAREAALLRAMGASRRQLQRAQAFEFGLLGLMAGVLAAAGAVATGWALATYAFHFPYRFTALPWVWGILGGMAVTLFGGWIGLRPVLRQPPLTSLREA